MILTAHDIGKTLIETLRDIRFDRLFILVDNHTRELCLPLVSDSLQRTGMSFRLITIPSGDENKTLSTLQHVWQSLINGEATRHSLLLCLGGGMVTDLGGFAAASFKRGIRYINVPTTLLAMVDASVGGKTGINFGGLKNEIGAFHQPLHVLLCSKFLSTLDRENRVSGTAEMIKHLLIRPADGTALSTAEELCESDISSERMGELIADSVATKQLYAEQDPTEKGIRKALNFGHTIGHAIEELLLKKEKPVLHGFAVGWGMIGELYISHIREGFPLDKMRFFTRLLQNLVGSCPITCNDYETIFDLIRHDKKNLGDSILCTLLADVGEVHIDCPLQKDELFESIDFIREAN